MIDKRILKQQIVSQINPKLLSKKFNIFGAEMSRNFNLILFFKLYKIIQNLFLSIILLNSISKKHGILKTMEKCILSWLKIVVLFKKNK